MLKIVVFDSGYGGEFFADYLQEKLPIVEIIRVIDWRNADKILKSPRSARTVAREALRPYIGEVDLIIFANHLLTVTSLKYFRRKFKDQKFIGLQLKAPDTFVKRDVLILTTKAVSRTINYYNFIFRIKRKTKTLTLDSWPAQIDDGELTEEEISTAITSTITKDYNPREVILACSQFNDIKPALKEILGNNIKIHDGFDDAVRSVCHTLSIRGGIGKKKN